MYKIEKWMCSYCKRVFDSWRECYDHEPICPENKCPRCVHAYYAYGCEFNCERQNEGKRCKFKEKVEE